MNERTRAIISSAVVLAANILAMYGVSVDTEVWVNGICAAVMLVSTCWALWKNPAARRWSARPHCLSSSRTSAAGPSAPRILRIIPI